MLEKLNTSFVFSFYSRLVLPAAFGHRPSPEEWSEYSTIAVLPASNLFPAQLHPNNTCLLPTVTEILYYWHAGVIYRVYFDYLIYFTNLK